MRALPNVRRWRCLTVGAGAAIVVAAACSDIPSDPKVPFSIEFNRAPSPSVVLGDTMFDSLGNAAPLAARVFNSKGEEIAGAPVRYRLVHDTIMPVTVDSVSGYVVARADPAFARDSVRVYAQAGALQSKPLWIKVTRRPDLLAAGGATSDSVMLSFLSLDSLLLSTPFTVKLRDTTGAPATAADSAVPSYLVRFAIVQPAGASTDTSYVMLTNGDRKRSELDTTDASGAASRQIRIRRVNFPFTKAAGDDGIIRDTIRVQASAYRAGHDPIPGSGVEFRFIVKANKQ